MIYKDKNKKVVNFAEDSKCMIDKISNTVTIISVEGLTIIPILTYGMNNEEGVFCILDFYIYE